MIEIDIVTPSKKIIEGAKVASLTLPTSLGEMTVLSGHTPLIALLGTGELSFGDDGQERRFAVSYGFAEIRGDKVAVLAETCEESTAIDKGRAAQAQKKAEEKLTSLLTPEEFAKYQRKLQRAITRQLLAG